MQVILPISKMPVLNYLSKEGSIFNIGDIVKVPFRNKEIIGIITSLELSNEVIDHNKMKYIIQKLDLPRISQKLLDFIHKVADYNISSISCVIKMVLPIDPLKKYKPNNKVAINPKKSYLTEAQKFAADHLISTYQNGYSVTLLNGVTGSGKTEVYFALIEKILEQEESQILILLPEIMLTSQLIKRFEDRFGFKPDQWHSGVSQSKKTSLWHNVANGISRLVVGARSALFLPYKNLSYIIVDEEHESSYKQEEKVNYHARDMAILRANKENIPILLASATPSLETVYNCKIGKYKEIKLESRYGDSVLPKVIIADMRSNKNSKNYISKILLAKIYTNLENNQQSMLFLNRKGYAPLNICSSCGYRCSCPDCSSWLVQHKKIARLECHHCGFQIKEVKICPECNKEDSFIACGPGVERIEEEVRNLFPKARILTLTRSEVNTYKKSLEIIDSILAKEIDIIIGTQVIAKGHHFPELSLVGIIDADIGLSGGDLRAAEKTFQLLHQVGGRAGRQNHAGQVIIQTFNPENQIIQSLKDNDSQKFINYELASRKIAQMPPYFRLASLIISSDNEEKLKIFAKYLAKIAPYNDKVNLLGPAPSPIIRVKRKYRYRFLLKSPKNFNIQNYINTWLYKEKTPSFINLKIDIDPYYFS